MPGLGNTSVYTATVINAGATPVTFVSVGPDREQTVVLPRAA